MSQSYRSGIIRNGLVRLYDPANASTWRDGLPGLRDVSGTSNTASLEGVTISNDGKGAFIFTGPVFVSSSVARPDNSNFTYGVFFNASVLPQLGVVLSDGHDNGNNGSGFSIVVNTAEASGNKIGFLANGLGWINSPAVTINANEWYYVVATRITTPSNRLQFYLNGVSLGFDEVNINPSNPQLYFTVGSQQPVGRYFTGSVAHVHVYDRALSAAEVAQMYEALRYRFL